MKELKKSINRQFDREKDKYKFLNEIHTFLHELSENKNPVNKILWVDKGLILANEYNPNLVAKREMELLRHSIDEDGFTQPIVTIWDNNKKKYVVVDGFHRYLVLSRYKDIRDRCDGKLPIVVIDKTEEGRMASTIRHNRARGKHLVDGMGDVVFKMLDKGMTEQQICRELGMEKDEIRRLKHITGFSKLFEDVEYKKTWETQKQLQLKKEYEKRQKKAKSPK